VAELIQKEYLTESYKAFSAEDEEREEDDDIIEKRENECFFSPEKGNVAFSSASDCWSFTLTGFAKRIAPKLGMNARALQRFLWGEFYYRQSDKKILKVAPTPESKVMFV
jgi:ribosome assembly protein 1